MKRKLICILVANLFVAAPAFAQSDDFQLSGSVGLGARTFGNDDQTDASYMNKYQDYSAGLLGLVDIRGRGGRYWFDFFGENFGRDDQYLSLRGGLYDVFKYRVYSDALKHQYLFNGRTPYSNPTGADQRATFPALNQGAWNNLDIGFKRRDEGLMFELQSASPWYVRIDGNQVRSSGSKPGASSQGLSPGNGFVDLAFPVEYTTRTATVEGGYNTKQMHFDLSWMTSKFENDNDFLTWTNGFFNNGIDRTELAADNKYQRIAGNATFRQLPWGTTIAARFTSDELTSDVGLLSSVLNTGGAIASTGPSTETFNGEVKNETFTITATSSPMKALDTRLYYNYRKRDDNSSHVSFSSTAIAGPFENEPFSYDTNNWGFDVYYRFNRANRVGGGYDYNDTDREGRHDYDRTKDKKLFVEWKNSSFDQLGARLKFQRLERDANFLQGDAGTSSSDVNYLNRFVTAFDLSGVEQDMWKLTLDYSPVANLDFGFEGIIKENDYSDNVLGRHKDDRREVYVNASYGMPGGPRFTVFGDWEEIEYESQHRIIGSATTAGAYDPATAPTAANYNWDGKVKDKNWAAGFAVDWPVMTRLTLKASAIYYKTDGKVDLALQEGVPASVTRPLAIGEWDDSKRTSFNIKAVYAFDKRWTFTGGWAYEKFEYTDSQYEGYRYVVPAANRADSYLNGVYANPQYKYNLFYGLVSYRF